MDEDQSTDTNVDTGSEAVADSNAEDTTIELSEVTDGDNSSPAESDAAETTDGTEQQNGEASGDETTDQPAESEQQEQTDQQAADAEATKKMTREERAEFFRNRQQEQQQQVGQSIDQAYQPQPLDQLVQYYVEQGFTEGEAYTNARLDIADQQQQLNNAKTTIAETQARAYMEAYDVVNSIDWMNHQNADTYDKEAVDAASAFYEQHMVVRDDTTGQIVGYKMMPKQYYGMIDQIRSSGSKQAQIKGQQAAERQMASVAPPTSTAPPKQTSSEDKEAKALSDAFDRI